MKTTVKDVENWINKFKSLHPSEIEDCFLHGNCYWFAQILAERFDGSEIYYLPILNHFICLIYDKEMNRDWSISKTPLGYFDITGQLTDLEEEPVNWENYWKENPKESARIYHYCINWDKEE